MRLNNARNWPSVREAEAWNTSHTSSQTTPHAAQCLKRRSFTGSKWSYLHMVYSSLRSNSCLTLTGINFALRSERTGNTDMGFMPLRLCGELHQVYAWESRIIGSQFSDSQA